MFNIKKEIKIPGSVANVKFCILVYCFFLISYFGCPKANFGQFWPTDEEAADVNHCFILFQLKVTGNLLGPKVQPNASERFELGTFQSGVDALSHCATLFNGSISIHALPARFPVLSYPAIFSFSTSSTVIPKIKMFSGPISSRISTFAPSSVPMVKPPFN